MWNLYKKYLEKKWGILDIFRHLARTSDIVPMAVTQGIRSRRLEGGLDRTLLRLHQELDGAVNHLEHEVVSSTVHRQQVPRRRTRLYIHLDIDRSVHVEAIDCKMCVSI